jgi:hypothetical protein
MSGSFLVSSARNLVPAIGERIFLNTAGVISWTVPAGVTSISIVVVGGGGGGGGVSLNVSGATYLTGGGGGGGGLAYATDISVTPGEILEINVGFGGAGGNNFVTGTVSNNVGSTATNGASGGSSWVRRQGSSTFIVLATGGDGGVSLGGSGGNGGIRQLGDGGSTGGRGGSGTGTFPFMSGAGGGGAAGYLGPGGNGASSTGVSNGPSQQGGVGTHGGGAGGTSSEAAGYNSRSGGYGGGVGIFGQRLDGVAPPASTADITGTGPGSAILIGGSTTITTATTGTSNITYNPYGLTGLASSTSNAGDDNFWTVNLPWNVNFLGTFYSQVFVGTNSYITFGAGSSAFSSLSGGNPAVPKIMIGAADNSGQRIWFGTVDTAPNRRFIIRFEGTAATSGTLGSPNMTVEYQFYESTPNQLDFHIVLNARAGTGINGIFNATGSESYTSFPNTAGNATRLISGGTTTVVVPSVINNQYIYAGGGAGAFSLGSTIPLLPASANQGQNGAVRIIWPGTTRRFPDQNVAPRNT